jgi:hypothetical protein
MEAPLGAPLSIQMMRLVREEFRFALPLNQTPFVLAEAGTQGPRTWPKSWVPASAGTNGI